MTLKFDQSEVGLQLLLVYDSISVFVNCVKPGLELTLG